jgi:hypothetical protein
LRRVEVLTLDDRVPCAYCCCDFGPDVLALRFAGEVFCTHNCLEQFAESIPGRDFVAAQDQALAEAKAILNRRPENFVLLYDSEESTTIGSIVMAQPQFVFTCIPAVAQLAFAENDVQPPD